MIEDERKQIENEQKRKERTQAYKRFAMTDDGKLILKDLESFCGYNNSSVSEQSPDAYQTFFAEGKRRVYLRINGFLRRNENEMQRV